MFHLLVIQELSFVIKIKNYFVWNGFIPIYDERIVEEQDCAVSQHLSSPQKWKESRKSTLKIHVVYQPAAILDFRDTKNASFSRRIDEISPENNSKQQQQLTKHA